MTDPLSIFDPFVVLHILGHLPVSDVCTLYNVARDWRTFIAQHNCLKAAYFKSRNIEPGIEGRLSAQLSSADEWYDLCRRHIVTERAWDTGHCRVRWAKQVFPTPLHSATPLHLFVGGVDPVNDSVVCLIPPQAEPANSWSILEFDRPTLRPILSSEVALSPANYQLHAIAGYGVFILRHQRETDDDRFVWAMDVFGNLPSTKRLRPTKPLSPELKGIIPGFHYLGRFHFSLLADEWFGLHMDCDRHGNVALLALVLGRPNHLEEVINMVVIHLADSRPPSSRPDLSTDLSTVLFNSASPALRPITHIFCPCANDDFFFIPQKTLSALSRVSGECLMSFSDVLVPGFQPRLAFDFGDTFNNITTRYKSNNGRFQPERATTDALWPPSNEFSQVMGCTIGKEGAAGTFAKAIFVRDGPHVVLYSNEGWMLVMLDFEDAIRAAATMCQADRMQKIGEHSIVIRTNINCLYLITSGSRFAICTEPQIVVFDLAKVPTVPFQQTASDVRLDAIVLTGCTRARRDQLTPGWFYMDSTAIYEGVALQPDQETSFKDGCDDSGLVWDRTWGARDWLDYPKGIRVFSFEPEHSVQRSTATKGDSEGNDEGLQRRTEVET